MTPSGVEDDYALMQAIVGGDSAALGVLYDRHSGAVLGLCLRILGTRAEAEEVLGDVFWHVWEQAGHFSSARGSPVAYLMTVARSRSIDRLRTLGRRQKVLVATDDPQGRFASPDRAGSGNDPFTEAALAEQRSRIELALGQLERSQRTAVEMSFFGGMSHSEIAETLGEPLGTIKSRIRQGLIRLKEGLQGQYGHGAPA